MKDCLPTGTMVVQVAATDADDPTYGNSARVVYSIIHGQPYFSVEPKTGWYEVYLLCCALISVKIPLVICNYTSKKRKKRCLRTGPAIGENSETCLNLKY